MLAPIILIIINALILISFNSAYSYKLSTYINYFKVPIEKTQTLIDRNIFNSVNSIMVKDIETYYPTLKEDGKLNLDFNDLNNYIANNMETTNSLVNINNSDIEVNLTSETIILTHYIDNIEDRKKYLNYYLNKGFSFNCSDGSTLPCTGNGLSKSESYSLNLKLVILDKEKIELEEKLLLPENYVGEHSDITISINAIDDKRSIIINEMANKKMEKFY